MPVRQWCYMQEVSWLIETSPICPIEASLELRVLPDATGRQWKEKGTREWVPLVKGGLPINSG